MLRPVRESDVKTDALSCGIILLAALTYLYGIAVREENACRCQKICVGEQ